jgi:hypothetical protein
MVFGKLTAISQSEQADPIPSRTKWAVRCECGNTLEVSKASLVSGNTKSCGCRKSPNLVGKRFGRLTVLQRAPSRPLSPHFLWQCQCSCGSLLEVFGSNLKRGHTTSCGCVRSGEELVGQVFGKWQVLHKDPSRAGKFVCRCECGNTASIATQPLISGSRICRCLRAELRAELRAADPANNPEAEVFRGMVRRCTEENAPQFKYYGAKGIKVLWNSFEGFYADMGPRPSPLHSIDRIDWRGDYSKENCRWADRETQNNNKSSNVILEYGEERMTVRQWERKLRLPYGTLHKRIKVYNWPLEEAITTPLLPRNVKRAATSPD